MFMIELSEDKTLIDQLFGKVDTNASSSTESTKLDFQVTRFLVGVAIEERPGPRWAIKCLGVLISKTSFLSTSTCLPLGKHAIITSDNPASGFLYAYGYTKGEPVPPYLQWATVSIRVQSFVTYNIFIHIFTFSLSESIQYSSS